MRIKFEQQLEQLNLEMIKMGSYCEEAIAGAAKCILDCDSTHLSEVKETEILIDHQERDIEAICMKLLLQQQPVAKDLRTISSALKMISDMERIGDQAADIAEIFCYIENFHPTSRLHIGEMARETISMVTNSIDSFVKKDLEAAKEVISADDKVDKLFNKVKNELCGIIRTDGEKIEMCLDLLMVAKYFERIGDHATNIAEWVCYSITGNHKY